jgi:4-hydroxy-2-oxoheptanedioate aldolase
MALGLEPRKGQTDPEFIDAVETILAAAKRHGVPAGIHTNSVDAAVQMIERGFQFTSLQSDDRFLMQRAKQEVDAVRAGLARDA